MGMMFRWGFDCVVVYVDGGVVMWVGSCELDVGIYKFGFGGWWRL